MKITLVSQYFHPEQFIVSELAADLQKRGHAVTVLTGLPNYPHGDFLQGYSLLSGPYNEVYNHCQIIRTPLFPRKQNFIFLALNYISFVISACLSFLRLPKTDVYFVYAPSPITAVIPALFYKFFTKKPVVIWLQDLWPDSLNAVGVIDKKKFIYKLFGQLVRWIYRHSDFILMQSPLFKENLLQYQFPLEKSEFVPNWGENLPLDSKWPEWVNALPKNKFIVTFAGNIGIAQSVHTIFEAARILSDTEKLLFIFAGDGRELESLKNKSASHNLKNILFVGRKPFSDMAPLFQASSVLLVTLKKKDIFEKTIPAKAIQYLSSGKPIVSAAGGITNQIITEATAGVAVEAENALALAEAIKQVMNLPESERVDMGKNGLSYFSKNFTKQLIVDRVEGILKKIVDQKLN